MHRLRPPAAIAAGALALWLALPAYVNYDTAWFLVWGRQLAHGSSPDLAAASAPTPHPLSTLLGLALAPLGTAAGDAATLLVLAALATVVWLALALGRAWFGEAAGWIAAALALTSVPLLITTARAYLDVAYLALVLGALLVESRRRRAGAPALALLALAGLWRPEAWLLSAGYWAWAARGRPREDQARLAALAVAAPAAWLLGDLLLAGDPLHSFTWTREQAAALGRARGPGALRQALPDKVATATGLPLLVAGTAGLALLLHRRPHAGRLAAAALGAALATAALLTAAGMPVVERYLLVPLVLLAVLAAGAASEVGRFRCAPRAGLAGLVAAALLAMAAPGRLDAVARQRDGLAAQAGLRADLRTLADRGALPARCPSVAAFNHKLIPLLALWTGRPPASFGPGRAEAYVEPASPRAERTLLLASSDPPEAPPGPPAGAPEIARAGAWRVEASC